MPAGLDPSRRAKAVRCLLLNWPVDLIAQDIGCHRSTIFRIKQNLLTLGTAMKPRYRTLGQPRKLQTGHLDLLREYALRNPLFTLAELVWFIWEEAGVACSKMTMSRAMRTIKLS